MPIEDLHTLYPMSVFAVVVDENSCSKSFAVALISSTTIVVVMDVPFGSSRRTSMSCRTACFACTAIIPVVPDRPLPDHPRASCPSPLGPSWLPCRPSPVQSTDSSPCLYPPDTPPSPVAPRRNLGPTYVPAASRVLCPRQLTPARTQTRGEHTGSGGIFHQNTHDRNIVCGL